MQLSSLPTPCALVDREVVTRNATRMRDKSTRLGVRLRPHVKTHKTRELARLQVDASQALTVSTLAEARFYADAGFDDLTLAVPLAPQAIAEAAVLAQRVRLGLLADHETTLDAMEATGVPLSVWLEIDCGYGRGGLLPDSPRVLDCARRLHESPTLELAGLLTHAGHSYKVSGREALLTIAEAERDVMLALADLLAESGLPRPALSIGSTPTLSVDINLDGITEVRPGNYIFYDHFQADIGACRPTDIAFSVLTTVIGSYSDRCILDAGALALSKDAGAQHVSSRCGYGRLRHADTGAPLQGHLESLSQEHGIVRGLSLPIGSRVRVLPNHSCLSAALFDRYFVHDGSAVVDVWTPTRGWR